MKIVFFIELFCKEKITEISVGVNGSDYELTDTYDDPAGLQHEN